MNPEQLRHDLRELWLTYYRDNRHWLSRLEVWITYNHQRRPSSSFILATVSVLNPQLTQLLPLLVDLNHDPDQMVEALGLNFNPEEALDAIAIDPFLAGQTATAHRLPSVTSSAKVNIPQSYHQDLESIPAASPKPRQSEPVAAPPIDNHPPSFQPASSSQQLLERPSRPIPRQSSHQSPEETTRQANAIDSGCEGRDHPQPLARRPRRKYTA